MLPLIPILGKIAGIAFVAGIGKLAYDDKKDEFKKKNPDEEYNAMHFLDDLKKDGQKQVDRIARDTERKLDNYESRATTAEQRQKINEVRNNINNSRN